MKDIESGRRQTELVTDTFRKERTAAMRRHAASIRRYARFTVLMLLGFTAAGCGASTIAEEVPVEGRRLQAARLVGHGAVAYEVGAYEIVFTERPGAVAQARRAALLVDLVEGRGHVAGFAEWGRSGEIPKTYVVGGWARQRKVEGELVTVFELALNYVGTREAPHPVRDPYDVTPGAVRILVNETSGTASLVSHR